MGRNGCYQPLLKKIQILIYIKFGNTKPKTIDKCLVALAFLMS